MRHEGRTERMLEYVVRDVQDRDVLVLAATVQQARDLATRLHKILLGSTLLLPAGELRFKRHRILVTTPSSYFEGLRFGAVHVDHFTYDMHPFSMIHEIKQRVFR